MNALHMKLATASACLKFGKFFPLMSSERLKFKRIEMRAWPFHDKAQQIDSNRVALYGGHAMAEFVIRMFVIGSRRGS